MEDILLSSTRQGNWQDTFILNKRKESFSYTFAKCHMLMLSAELELLKLNGDIIDGEIKTGLLDEHKKFRQENQRMFADLKANKKQINYQILMPLYQFCVKEVENLKEKLSKNPKTDKNLIKKGVFIYIYRLNHLNEKVYMAGTKSENDLYSKNSSSDWQMLNYHTEELIFNTEHICKQNYGNISMSFKKFIISVYKSNNSLPDQNSEMFDQFLKSELNKMNSGSEFYKSFGKLKKKVKLKLGSIIPEVIHTRFKRKSIIEDDFQQAIAAPKFEVLGSIATLQNDSKVLRMHKKFSVENIKTNKLINIPVNTFQAILKEDIVSRIDEDSSNTVRPFMVKDCEELTIDTKDLLPPAMNKFKDQDIIGIRLISPCDLEQIEDYISDKKFEKRIISQNQNGFKALNDYNKENISDNVVNLKDLPSNVINMTHLTTAPNIKEFKNIEEYQDKVQRINNIMNYSSKSDNNILLKSTKKKEFSKEKQHNLHESKKEEPRDKLQLQPKLLKRIYLDDDYPIDMHIHNKSPPKYQKKLNLINLSSENQHIFNKDVSLKKTL